MIESYEDFPEMNEILDLANQVAPHEVHIRGWVRSGNRDFPLVNFSFGEEGPGHPQLILTGGVHGLEKVGTHVLISFLKASSFFCATRFLACSNNSTNNLNSDSE